MVANILKQPEPKDALIVTLNSMGYMLSQPERYIQAFVDFSAYAPGPVLDIGAAYGVATIPALEKGAYVIANDLDVRHLQILKSKVPSSLLDHLQLKPGRMPTEVDFEENSLGAVLASRILGFIPPKETEISLKKIFKWLKPGGKFFFLGGSPYMGTFRKFLPTYQKRKVDGHPWPGFLEDIPFCSPERAGDLPRCINLLDEATLSRSLTKAGFIIEKIGFNSALEEHPQDMKLDGREQIGAIAHKP
ncbi:MAG: class I SAM-dependent methyltransferase [Alphaproteobacteria bacterium]|nr:class I SAM-dependent methyltransferase [Alphaproteobacteria bacterium]